MNREFDLTLEFHTEDQPKYNRPTSIDGRQICFWPILRLPNVPSWQTGRFSVQEGQKIDFLGVRRVKTHMMYFDWGNRNLPEKVDFGRQNDSFWPFFEPWKIDFTCILGLFCLKKAVFLEYLKNKDFCNFSVFLTPTNNCDGEFDLTLEFHTEDPCEIQAIDIIRWPTDMFLAAFKASQRGFRADWIVFGVGGQKNRLFVWR